MPSVFFKIGSTDYTGRVDPQSYAVNLADEYPSWKDCNQKEHREVYRQRRKGGFSLGFRSTTDFASFRSTLNAAKTADGYWAVTAYVSNTGSTDTFNAFLDIENPQDAWDLAHSRQWLVSKVTITEV